MNIGFVVVWFAAFLLGMYLLYSFGCIPVQRKRAFMFVGRAYHAKFASCTGSIYRVLRFREDREVRFLLESMLSQGELYVELTDPDRRLILRLDDQNPSAQLKLEAGVRYRMVVHFRSATGSYALNWH